MVRITTRVVKRDGFDVLRKFKIVFLVGEGEGAGRVAVKGIKIPSTV